MKNKNNSNLNSYRENSKRILRPKSVFKNKMGPIKIMSVTNTTKNNNKDKFLKKINDENKDNNIMKPIKHKGVYKIYHNKNNNYNTLETREDLTLDNQSNLPILSFNTHTINDQRAKTAKERYKMKLDNLELMFNAKPNFYYEKKKGKILIKKFGLIPGIPNELMPRLKLVFSIFNNPNIQPFIDKAPSKMQNDIQTIANYLYEFKTNNKFPELDKYSIFFYYLCTKLQYDVKGINKDNKNLEEVFSSGYANSLQFCKIFELMCKKHLLRVKRISGFCKSKVTPQFKVGTDCNIINHHWNAIYIHNKWYFCDLTFGSGGIKPRGEFKKNYFNPFYFLTLPDILIETHYPSDEIWQLSTKIIPMNQFSSKKEILFGEFYKQVYEHNIQLVSHEFPIIHHNYCNKPLVIQIGVKEMAIQSNLYLHNFRNKISDIKFNFNDKKNIFSLEPIFPENGDYWVEILYREFASNETQYLPLINYKILVDNSLEKYFENLKKQKILQVKKEEMIKELKKKRPKSMGMTFMPGSIIDRKDLKKMKTQKICLDNEGAYLISPSNNNIKMGHENDFKIKVPNSVGVCVLDGKNWNYLKRKKNDKNMWFGKVNIDNPNVTILSMKENSLFTEVFQLKARNVNGNLLKSSRTSREKDKKIKFGFN